MIKEPNMLKETAQAVPRWLFSGGRLLGAGFLLGSAQTVLAAEGAEHQDPWVTLAYQSINFGILLAVLIYFLRKPIQSFLTNLSRRVKEALDDTRDLEKESAISLEREKKSIANLDTELANMMAEVRAESEKEANRLSAEAQEMASKLKAQIQSQMGLETNKALEILRHELAEEIIRQAEKLVKEKMDPKKQEKLVAEHINHLGTVS
ncbi:MAG: ATP synthase F0 subunit B [Deltaproteobacteria bacterium]|nr:ATP synthase F0 subunit B [Deltaproteobacteria bacterium]